MLPLNACKKKTLNKFGANLKLMKILITAPNLITGGAEKQLLYLIDGLLERGNIIYLLLLQHEGEYIEKLPESVKLMDPKTPRPVGIMKEIWKIREIKKAVDEVNPDILYSRLWPTKTATLISGILRKKPVVFSEDRSLNRYTEYKTFTQFFKLQIRKLSCRLASMIIPVSDGIKGELLKDFHVNPEKVKLIYNGFDFEDQQKKASEQVDHRFFQNRAEKGKTIVALGRMVKLKGFDYLLESLKILKDKGLRVNLIMIGKGDYLDNLKMKTSELGLNGIVDFMGFVDNPFSYMAKSDIFVLSSLFEGLPSTLIEAMALGLPVISTRCPTGPEEIINDNENGLLVPVADSVALADAIEKVLSDNDLAQRLRTAGKKRALDFTLDKMYESFSVMFGSINSRKFKSTI